MRVTLADIATKADVSPSTVSRVLNNKGRISDKTRTRVLSVATQLGYDLEDRKDRNRTMNVGVLFDARFESLAADPFYSTVMLGAQMELKGYDYHVFFSTIERENLDRVVHTYRERFDGLILVGCEIDGTVVDRIQGAGIPFVLVDNDLPGSKVNAIVTDNVEGAEEAIRFLAKLGHRRIGFVGGPQKTFLQRHQGYKNALASLGLEWSRQQEVLFEAIDNEDVGRAQAAVQDLLLRVPDMTAIFACNDKNAIGAIRGVVASGRKVPHDVSVIGYDDLDISQHMDPPLTTLHIDKMQMGAMAGRRLYELIQGVNNTPTKIVVTSTLVVRESVRSLVNTSSPAAIYSSSAILKYL